MGKYSQILGGKYSKMLSESSDQLSPDVEALRQRNMARGYDQAATPFQRIAQAMQPAVAEPMNTLAQAGRQLNPFDKSSEAFSPRAGLMNLAAGFGGLSAAPLGWTSQLIENAPESVVSPEMKGLNQFVNQKFGNVGTIGGKVLTRDIQNIPMPFTSDKERQQISDASGRAGSFAAQVMAGKLVHGVVQNVANISSFNPEQQSGMKGLTQFKKAIPAGKNELGYDPNLQRAMGVISKVAREKPLDSRVGAWRNIRTAEENIRGENQAIWNKSIAPRIIENADKYIESKSIGNTLRNLVDNNLERFDAKQAEAIKTEAAKWDSPMTLDDLNKRITTINAEADKYYNADAAGKAAMLEKRPTLEADIEAANKGRELLFNKLEELGVKGIRQVRKQYGAVAEVTKNMRDEIVKAEKEGTQNAWYNRGIHPYRLATDIATIGISKFLRKYNSPNALMGRAYSNLGKANIAPVDVTQTSPPPFIPREDYIAQDVEYRGFPTLPPQQYDMTNAITPEKIDAFRQSLFSNRLALSEGRRSELIPNARTTNNTPFVPSPTIAGQPQPFVLPDNLRMMPKSSIFPDNISNQNVGLSDFGQPPPSGFDIKKMGYSGQEDMGRFIRVAQRAQERAYELSKTPMGIAAKQNGVRLDAVDPKRGYQFTDVNGTESTFYAKNIQDIPRALAQHRKDFYGK